MTTVAALSHPLTNTAVGVIAEAAPFEVEVDPVDPAVTVPVPAAPPAWLRRELQDPEELAD